MGLFWSPKLARSLHMSQDHMHDKMIANGKEVRARAGRIIDAMADDQALTTGEYHSGRKIS